MLQDFCRVVVNRQSRFTTTSALADRGAELRNKVRNAATSILSLFSTDVKTVMCRSEWQVRDLRESLVVHTHACSAGAPARASHYLGACRLLSCACCLLLACSGLLRVDCNFPPDACVLGCLRCWCLLQCGGAYCLFMIVRCGLRSTHRRPPV